jgi:hypothetical protein
MRHKLLKIWLVAFLAAVLMSEAARAELSKSQQNSIKGSVVSIINRLGEDSIGSGIVVSYPKGSADCIYVLTNAHVAFAETEDGKSLEAKLDSLELYFHPKWFRNDEKITPRDIVKYSSDPNPDLALLEVEKKHFKQVPSAYTIKSDATLTAETEVTHFGFPDTRTIIGLGQGWGVAVSMSRIKSEQWIKQNVGDGSLIGLPSDKYFYTSPGIGGGGSGGAFFDSNGNWIGLHCIGFPTKNGILEKNFYNAIIKPNVIAKFLGTAPHEVKLTYQQKRQFNNYFSHFYSFGLKPFRQGKQRDVDIIDFAVTHIAMDRKDNESIPRIMATDVDRLALRLFGRKVTRHRSYGDEYPFYENGRYEPVGRCGPPPSFSQVSRFLDNGNGTFTAYATEYDADEEWYGGNVHGTMEEWKEYARIRNLRYESNELVLPKLARYSRYLVRRVGSGVQQRYVLLEYVVLSQKR